MSETENPKTKRVGRWYFGGLSSAGAVFVTHPLDLLKVHLQTQQSGKMTIFQMGMKVVKVDGFFGLYNGLTASLLRQMTYSLTRFAIYETAKGRLDVPGRTMPFYEKVLLGGFAGCLGGLVGTPADLINVRMQNDVKLPPAERRNYKHALDGLYQVIKQDGPLRLMNGASMAATRATFVTIGQISFYDQYKVLLLRTAYFKDDIYTYFTASFLAGGTATLLTMPLDVMKTRMMNAPPGTYSSLLACAKDIGKSGPQGFFKGFLPAFVRLGPHTIITFLLFEQLKAKAGYVVPA